MSELDKNKLRDIAKRFLCGRITAEQYTDEFCPLVAPHLAEYDREGLRDIMDWATNAALDQANAVAEAQATAMIGPAMEAVEDPVTHVIAEDALCNKCTELVKATAGEWAAKIGLTADEYLIMAGRVVLRDSAREVFAGSKSLDDADPVGTLRDAIAAEVVKLHRRDGADV